MNAITALLSRINISKAKELLLKTVLPTVLITGIVLFSISPVSCKLSEEGIQILTGDFTVPHLTQIDVPDGEHVVFGFSKPVKDVDAFVCRWEEDSISAEESNLPAGKIDSSADSSALGDTSIIPVTKEFSAQRNTVTFTLAQKTKVGHKYSIEGTVADDNGNTLTFSIPFSGYNSDIPKLIISEIRNAYSSSTDKTTGSKKYKCEFIELFSLTGGNLSGVEVLSAADGEDRRYVFPSCEINAGEYIVVHLRSKEEGCVDETDGNLTLSYATDSCDTARDFWAANDKACLGNSDAVVVRNGNTGELIDTVLFAQSTAAEWADGFAELLSAVEQSGKWVDEDGNASCAIQSAFVCDGITSSAATRTMSRQNVLQSYNAFCADNDTAVTDSADQWIVTANKGSGKNKQPGDTPGFVNSTNVYVK